MYSYTTWLHLSSPFLISEILLSLTWCVTEAELNSSIGEVVCRYLCAKSPWIKFSFALQFYFCPLNLTFVHPKCIFNCSYVHAEYHNTGCSILANRTLEEGQSYLIRRGERVRSDDLFLIGFYKWSPSPLKCACTVSITLSSLALIITYLGLYQYY